MRIMGAVDPAEAVEEQPDDELQSTPDDQPDQLGAIPFFDVQSLDGARVHVRAGWANAEEVELSIEARVELGSAQDQILTAFNWWRDRWAELFQASQEPAEEPVDDAE